MKTKEEILNKYEEDLVKLTETKDKELDEFERLEGFRGLTGLEAKYRYYGKCPGFDLGYVAVEELARLITMFPPNRPVEIDHKKKYEVSHKICLKTCTHMSHGIKEDTVSFYWMVDDEQHVDVDIPLAALPCLDKLWSERRRSVTDIEFDHHYKHASSNNFVVRDLEWSARPSIHPVAVSWTHGDEFVHQPTIDEVIKLITEQVQSCESSK